MKTLHVVHLEPLIFQVITKPDGTFRLVPDGRPDAEPVCQVCYGRPLPGFRVCSRTRCIAAEADMTLWRTGARVPDWWT
jgi:hypothetical protein